MFPNSDPGAGNQLGGIMPRPRLELPRDREAMEALAKNGGLLGVIWVGQSDVDDIVRDIETAPEVMRPDHVGWSTLTGSPSLPGD